MGRRKVTAFAGAIAASMIGYSPAHAAPVEGAWAIHDLILDIYKCDEFVCGRMAWVKYPRRRQLDCGRTIVW